MVHNSKFLASGLRSDGGIEILLEGSQQPTPDDLKPSVCQSEAELSVVRIGSGSDSSATMKRFRLSPKPSKSYRRFFSIGK